MYKPMRKLILYILISFFISSTALAGSVKISVSTPYGQSDIRVGDVFYITYTIINSDATPPNASAPGAKFVYLQQQSSQFYMSSENGRSTESSKAVYVATMKAVSEGNFSFGPVSVGDMKSNKVSYRIGAGGNNNSSNSSANDSNDSPADSKSSSGPKFIGKGDSNLFLRATVSSSNAYEQQAIVYTVKLYSTYSTIKFVGATAAPKFDGFVVEDTKDHSNQLSYESYNGKTYATAVIAKYIIFPQMTGSLKVSGNTYTVAVDQRQYYHDPLFGSLSFATPLQLNVTPNDLVINVKSLPEPKPADFSGGVGRFSLSAKLKTSDFKTNQAASIVYTISGSGNIKYVQLPDLSTLYPTELEIYSPTSSQDVRIEGGNVSGTVSFDYSFMPLEEGTFNIPDIKLVYFNPESGQYETSVAKGYTINVGKGKAPDSKKGEVLRFIPKLSDVSPSSLRKIHTLPINGFAYWLWYIIPTLLLFGVALSRRRYIKLHADMEAFNSRRANKIAKKRLKKAAYQLKQGNKDKFYDELLAALWGYIGFKLKIPTSELMRDNIRQVLSEHGVNSNVIDSFINNVDNAEFAKYSSNNVSVSMQNSYDEAAQTIDMIESEFKKTKKES